MTSQVCVIWNYDRRRYQAWPRELPEHLRSDDPRFTYWYATVTPRPILTHRPGALRAIQEQLAAADPKNDRSRSPVLSSPRCLVSNDAHLDTGGRRPRASMIPPPWRSASFNAKTSWEVWKPRIALPEREDQPLRRTRPGPELHPVAWSPRLRLISFGVWLRGRDQIAYNYCEEMHAARKFATFSDATLEKLLCRRGIGRADVYLDCRMLRNPQNRERTRNHCGLHPAIIQHWTNLQTDDGKTWQAILHRAKMQLQPIVSNCDRSLVVAVYCKSGRHSSVGVAESLRQILQREAPGMDVPAPQHYDVDFCRHPHDCVSKTCWECVACGSVWDRHICDSTSWWRQ